MARRRFGWIRRLPSGRWQASFLGPNARRQTAPHTFATRAEASRWLAKVELDLGNGTWINDEQSRVPFGDYARQWLDDNTRIGPRWRETCERNLRLHLSDFDNTPLKALTPTLVRSWYSAAMRGTGGNTSVAQSYRFMRAVLNTAVREGAIAKNPCTIPGAGSPKAARRRVAAPGQVEQLVEAIPGPTRRRCS